MHKIILTASLLAVALAASAAFADPAVYKWVDEQGKVHYSTEPHPDAKQIAAPASPATPAAGTPAAPGVPGAAATPSSPADDAKLVQPDPSDSPACKAGRDRLFKYLHADNLYSVDEKGNKVTMSADEKQKALDESRDYVRQACGGGA